MTARREGTAADGARVFMWHQLLPAVYDETPPPIGKPAGKKGHMWGKRKVGE